MTKVHGHITQLGVSGMISQLRVRGAIVQKKVIGSIVESGYEVVGGPDGAPSLLIATTFSATRIDLAWMIGSTNQDGHAIERTSVAGGGSGWSQIDTVLGTIAIYSDNTCVVETTYYYRVRAYKSTLYSDYSNIDSATTESEAPAIPTGLTLTLISGGVKIDWTDNSGGTAQTEIWARSNGGASALLITKDAGIVTHNDILFPVDLRYYKIRAKIGTNYSEFTAEESIAMLGGERVLNGGFDDNSIWVITGGGNIITGGVLHVIATNSTYQNNVLEANKTYSYSIKATIVGGTDVKLLYYIGTLITIVAITMSGTYTGSFTVVGTPDFSGRIYINASGTGINIDIDDVSIKEILVP